MFSQLLPKDIVPNPPPLLTIAPTYSIKRTLELLDKQGIRSIPVTSHNDPKRVVSIIDTLDIIDYCAGFSSIHQRGNIAHKLHEPVEVLIPLSAERESYIVRVVDAQDPIRHLLKGFGHKSHRVLVVDYMNPENAPFLLTQTDLIRYLHKHMDELCNQVDFDKSIAELGLARGREVVSLSSEESTLVGFKRLLEHGWTSMPIVEHAKVIGNLRAYDARHVAVSNLDCLDMPVVEFLTQSKDGLLPPATCTRDSTLRQVITLMMDASVHHVWVVDGQGSVVDVVSMTDICALFA